MKSIKVIIALLMTLVCIPFSNVSALENTDNNNTVIYTHQQKKNLEQQKKLKLQK